MQKTKKKKNNRRARAENSALKPELNLRARFELIDYDYLNKLSPKELKWLNKFTEEYVNANLSGQSKKLHNTKELKKDCYDRNNARNRCVYTKAKASGNVVDTEVVEVFEVDEDEIVESIDLKKKLNSFDDSSND